MRYKQLFPVTRQGPYYLSQVSPITMEGNVWIILMLMISGMKAERVVKGFEMLESLSEDLMARENVVNAETPFSPTLSVCLWINPKHLAKKHASIQLFELRTNLTRRIKGKPSNTNWPSINTFIGGNSVDIMDCAKAELEDMPKMNYLRRWTNLCFAFDFPANEAKISMNGKLIGKFKDPTTNGIFENQFGGKSILRETKDSRFFFTFGRYFFSDVRHPAKIAGIKAWDRILSDQEMTSLSQCEEMPDMEDGNLLSNKTIYTFPPNSQLLREATFNMSSFLCTKPRSHILYPIPIPVDTKDALIDVCRKFGSGIYLGGDIGSIEDINNIREILFSNPNFGKEC